MSYSYNILNIFQFVATMENPQIDLGRCMWYNGGTYVHTYIRIYIHMYTYTTLIHKPVILISEFFCGSLVSNIENRKLEISECLF